MPRGIGCQGRYSPVRQNSMRFCPVFYPWNLVLVFVFATPSRAWITDRVSAHTELGAGTRKRTHFLERRARFVYCSRQAEKEQSFFVLTEFGAVICKVSSLESRFRVLDGGVEVRYNVGTSEGEIRTPAWCDVAVRGGLDQTVRVRSSSLNAKPARAPDLHARIVF